MKYFFLAIVILFNTCQTANVQNVNSDNPPAEGFNAAASDKKAIEIADQVMQAMGGRTNWDATRYIKWTFFGRRNLLWDKREGNVMVELPSDSLVIFINLFDKSKAALIKANETITQQDSIAKYAAQAKSIWINDAYWLVMPFKLKDSGVTLKYLSQEKTDEGIDADVLQLTFEQVGDTPNNKYWVYVDQKDKLVKQWDFYRNATDSIPAFSTPWTDYQTYGNILLSSGRGQRGLSNIAVFDTLPDSLATLPLFGQ
jgi:plasmid maintenance system killer protein